MGLAPLSEMERETYLEVIQDLRESVHSTHEMIKSLQDELSRSNRNQEKSNQLIKVHPLDFQGDEYH